MTPSGLVALACVGILASTRMEVAWRDVPPVPKGNRNTEIRLVRQVSLGDYGGVPFVIDLDGDGKLDFLWLQSAGIFQSKVFDLPQYSKRFEVSAEEQNHYCLTATDESGRILWQFGQPWRGARPFVTHCSERSVDAADIDGDGQVEVVAATLGKLLVLDGRNGRLKNSTRLESDNFQIVRLARMGPGPAGWVILVQNQVRVVINDRRYAWIYEAVTRGVRHP